MLFYLIFLMVSIFFYRFSNRFILIYNRFLSFSNGLLLFSNSFLSFTIIVFFYRFSNDFYPQWAEGRIHPPFPCVSYEATKRVSRWQRVYGMVLRWPLVLPVQSRLKRPGCRHKTLSLFSNLSCPIRT